MALRWVFTADTGPFRRGLDQMRTEAKAWSSTMTRMFAGVFSAAAVIGGFKNWLREMDKLDKAAKKLGTSVEGLQRAKLVGDQNAISLEQLTNLMVRLERRFGEAARGSDHMATALANLGLEAHSFANLDVDQKVLLLAQAYKRAEGSGTELADLMKVLDTEARELLPLLKQGPEALAEAMERASTVSGATVEKVAALNDRLTEMRNRVSYVFARVFEVLDKVARTVGEVVGSLIAIFSKFFSFLVDGFKAAYQGIRQGLIDTSTDPLKEAFDNILTQAAETGKEINRIMEDSARETVDIWAKAADDVATMWERLRPLLPEEDMFRGRTPFSGRNDPANPFPSSQTSPSRADIMSGRGAQPRNSTSPLLDFLRGELPAFDPAATREPNRSSIPVSSIRSIGGDAGGGAGPSKLLEINSLQLATLRSIDSKLGTTDDGLSPVAEPRG